MVIYVENFLFYFTTNPINTMCSANHSLPILQPIRPHHQEFLEEIFPKVPVTFVEEFLQIACFGMHTEIITAISLLTPIQQILSGQTSTEDNWRKGGSGVLFSALPKIGGAKLQTPNMKLLHDHVIPWLATENMSRHRKQLNKIGISAVFMHSCGDERFPSPLWEEESDRRAQMFAEQRERTEADWKYGVREVDDDTILNEGMITSQQLNIVNNIINFAEIAPQRITPSSKIIV